MTREREKIEEYDSYLRGDVYEYIIEDPNGEIVESCCGFYGYDYAEKEMKQALDNYVNSIAIQLPLLGE